MNTTDDKYDIRLKELFGKTGTESPSEKFTANVMQQIAQLDAASQPLTENNARNNWYWGGGISLLVVLGLGLMYYFNLGILPDTFKPTLAPLFGGILNSFKGIFASIEISSTTIVIILGFVLLVVIERILNKLKLTRNIYLSF